MTEFEGLKWFEAIKSIMIDPKEFFGEMSTDGGYEEPLVFAVMNFVIVSFFWGILYFSSIGVFGGLFFDGPLSGFMSNIGLAGLFAIPFMLVSSLISGVISIFVIAAISHVLLIVVGGKGSYEGTLRVVAYTTAFLLISWIPVLGILIGIYALYVVLIGYSNVHEISKGRALLALLIPMLAILLAIFSLFFFFGLMGPITSYVSML
ncbi:MAG: YIP1 family protein [Candidatus Aenigmatarchaeota archaeon]